MPVLVEVFRPRMQPAGLTPAPALGRAVDQHAADLGAVGAGKIEARHLGLARWQVLEVKHGQAVDDAGLVEQSDLEGGLRQVGAERLLTTKVSRQPLSEGCAALSSRLS